MKTLQITRKKNQDWTYLSEKLELKKPLVLVFGNRYLLEDTNLYDEIRNLFPDGELVFGSTCGDIASDTVNEESITVTAIEFEKSSFVVKTSNILNANEDSFKSGKALINQLPQEDLKFVFVVSEGSFTNGSELTRGMDAVRNEQTIITGGLCGDDDRFETTLASYNENPKKGEAVAIGFYGDTLEISFSIKGGWTPFGPERIVTKSDGNTLFELDNKPALDLYKTYLGEEKSKELPGAALMYPLNVQVEKDGHSFVRSVLSIDEETNAMTLAGSIPQNSKVQLMMTNVDNIANATEIAATQAVTGRKTAPELAILMSCIGRKLVLDQRVEEELEEVSEIVGDNVTVAGFYSYGEIAPFYGLMSCQLHNQTMTITLISE